MVNKHRWERKRRRGDGQVREREETETVVFLEEASDAQSGHRILAEMTPTHSTSCYFLVQPKPGNKFPYTTL